MGTNEPEGAEAGLNLVQSRATFATVSAAIVAIPIWFASLSVHGGNRILVVTASLTLLAAFVWLRCMRVSVIVLDEHIVVRNVFSTFSIRGSEVLGAEYSKPFWLLLAGRGLVATVAVRTTQRSRPISISASIEQRELATDALIRQIAALSEPGAGHQSDPDTMRG